MGGGTCRCARVCLYMCVHCIVGVYVYVCVGVCRSMCIYVCGCVYVCVCVGYL